MIYTPLTNKAMKFAYKAHEGQYDRSGIPYIFHPFHVAEEMTDEISTCAALLHDVVEDTDISMEELEKLFPKEVTDAVELLTHEPDTDYYAYVHRLKSNPVAKAVKWADLRHNMDESRLTGNTTVTDEQIRRWREKYTRAKQILEED